MLSLAAGSTVNWTTQSLVLSSGIPASSRTVIWQSSSNRIALQSGSVTTNTNGIAAKTPTVGPLTEGQTVTAQACLNGSSPCITFTAFGARPEYATLEAVSGTSQSVSVEGTAGQVTLRVLDMDGNPMAGGVVTLYQALYAWAPPCPPHGRCATADSLPRKWPSRSPLWMEPSPSPRHQFPASQRIFLPRLSPAITAVLTSPSNSIRNPCLSLPAKSQ